MPLPGIDGQLAMSPPVRAAELEKSDIASARRSAVLLLFFPDQQNNTQICFIQRNTYDGVHSGQISFPGGKMEESDHSLMHTALRETEEEVGVPVATVKVFRELTELYIPPSHFLVQPFMGIVDAYPAFRIDPIEVADILIISLEDLLHPKSKAFMEVHTTLYGTMNVPCYHLNPYQIWGATAMILSEALELIRSTEASNQG